MCNSFLKTAYRMNKAKLAPILCLFLCSGVALAQSAEKEPVAIVELGVATSWNVKGGAATFGPDFAVEVTPIENRLELEVGTTPFFTHKSTELDTDLLFKKPWTFSKKVEFMFGAGPEWVHINQNHTRTNSVAAEVVGTLCSGPPENIGSVGISNRPTITISGTGMNNPLASARVY